MERFLFLLALTCTFRINGSPFPHQRCVIRLLLLVDRFHISHVLTIHLQTVGSTKHACKARLCTSMILKHVILGRYREPGLFTFGFLAGGGKTIVP